MGYRLTSIGGSQIADRSLLPADLQDGSQVAQLLVTKPDKSWGYSPALSSPPAVDPVFALAGDPARPTAPIVLIQLPASGTGNLSEWRSAVGALLARLDAAGKLTSTRYILQVPSAGGPDLALVPVTGGQSVLAVWHGLQINALRQSTPDYTPANVGAVGDYHVIIPLNQANKVGVGIRAKAGQTGDLQQWQDSAGAILARISAGGVLFGNGSGLTNVPVGAHTHPGSDISSQVASAVAADVVPWTGVSGKPSAFPPSAHSHAGSDITTPVGNAASADTVPWTGVIGKPATFPPSGHSHNGADILDNTLAGSKLQDSTVSFAKLRTDQNAFVDLTTAPQALNGAAPFASGIYACRLSVPNGAIAPFTLSVGSRNGSFEFTANNAVAASMAVGGVPGATFIDFSNMFDGRTYRLTFNTTTGVGTLHVISGIATGQTSLTFRRIV